MFHYRAYKSFEHIFHTNTSQVYTYIRTSNKHAANSEHVLFWEYMPYAIMRFPTHHNRTRHYCIYTKLFAFISLK